MSSSSEASSSSSRNSQHSSLSRSPSNRPTPSATPSLDTLIPHLLASKRSLTSINHVWRANEICTSTRSALENNAVVTARISFVRSGITSQLGVLSQVQHTADNTFRKGRAEFELAVRDLDDANARLCATLDKLRNTIVEAGIRPQGEEKRNLLDFVDESGVDGLVGAIKDVIDGAGDGLKNFQEGNMGFEREVGKVRSILDGNSDGTDSPTSHHKGREEKSPIPEILQDLEDHAQEMAQNLESLVSHFDLCVSAIKSTEGGGDAASKIVGELPEGVDVDQTHVSAPPAPISDEERTEMMRVLEEDAGQVEDVVMEIKGRVVEMEALYERVEVHADRLRRENASADAAFRLLEEIGRKLSGYISQSQNFLLKWGDAKGTIEERLEELEALRDFYNGFLRAYDNLIIEIGRRKAMEERMDRVAQEAISKLDKLHEADVEEREAFKKAQGDFLPVDIWPGLMNAPLRFDIREADGDAERVPDISKSVIRKAILRVHGK